MHAAKSFPSPLYTQIIPVNGYSTRAAAKKSFYIPKARTNYGKFNIRFQGPKIWNSIDESIKKYSFHQFKKNLKRELISKCYCKLQISV